METYEKLPDDNRAFGAPPSAGSLPDLSTFVLRCRGCSFTATAGSAGLQLAIMHEQDPPKDCAQHYDIECGGWEIL